MSTVAGLLDEAPRSRFHRRAVVVSGMGFFTDAYDLFVISTVATLVKSQWHLSTTETSWVTGAAILGAVLGAFVFGRLADIFGRKTVYVTVASVMIVGALGSALAPSAAWLIVARVVLGLGVGGDYPVSAVLMSEYANRADRGRMVSLVFSMQALGLIVGPLVGLVLLSSGLSSQIVWRILLGVGVIPAASVIVLRARMPESPRFVASVQGDTALALAHLRDFSEGTVTSESVAPNSPERLSIRAFLRDRRMIRLLVATAGSWFLFDYAYYGNTLSLPQILKEVDPTASLEAKLAWSLLLFVLFALPGYGLAIVRMDRIGHRRLQYLGFAVMAGCFGLLALAPPLVTHVAPFLAIFGVSYFFVEFGPNTTTFVLPSELFPVSQRTTGHGVAAGVGKLGAFLGVFLVPILQNHWGLRGMLAMAAVASLGGLWLTRALPEPAGQPLDEVSPVTKEAPKPVSDIKLS
ncbi:MAG: MFS transporter [Acidimicrobiaceae bacterium]|nr:MFS transporter [Acidimicrobiaceae bacterium]